MSKPEATYSQIISPEDFNKINTEQHLYMSTADAVVKELIIKETKTRIVKEVVEVGCGPARVLPLIGTISGIKLMGFDYDPEFVAYAREKVSGTDIDVQVADISTFKKDTPTDVFYSLGVHHHIGKGKSTDQYLSVLYEQLPSGGCYIVDDEFLADYSTEEERKIRTTIWYAHIISNAQIRGFSYLAREEAKTLLDDLCEEDIEHLFKSPDQIELVLKSVGMIDKSARAKNMILAESQAEEFLEQLQTLINKQPQGDPTLDLSRGDYKICDRVFRQEVEHAGFSVESMQSIGPVENIGAFLIYVLRK